MKIDNIVIGSSIKALLYAYKKGFYFLPCKENIEPLFHEYMDYGYTYMQFGINDKKPNTFRTNEGYKLYGPHKRQIYDLLVYDMLLSGRILFLNVKKTVSIEGQTISITSFDGHSHIDFDTLHLFEIGEVQTDFSNQKYSKFTVFDWYEKRKQFSGPEDIDLVYIKQSQMRRIYNLPKHIVIMSRHNDLDEAHINDSQTKIFDIYELMGEMGFDLRVEVMRRDIHEIAKHRIIVQRDYVKFPDIPMIKLLEMNVKKGLISSTKNLKYAGDTSDSRYLNITARNNEY